MKEAELKPCPFCGGKAELKKHYESCDGRGDRYAKITCLGCTVEMSLTWKEFGQSEKDFGYTGGYYSQNRLFWDGMHQMLIDKWNRRVWYERSV